MSSVADTTAPLEITGVVDVETLIAPLPGENPAGESVQYSGLYDEIREARRSEDNLEQGEWKRDSKVADWNEVESLSTGALATRTKDLQIGAWLAEALVKIYGFAGLRDGLKITRKLQEQHWDHLYPEAEEGDLEGRANALSWMDRQLAMAVKEVPLTKGSSGTAYSYLNWEESTKFDIPENYDSLEFEAQQRVDEVRQRASDEGRVTSEDWRRAKNGTRRAFYEETYALLNECWDEFHVLDHVMDEKFGRETPGLGDLKKSLDNVRTLVEKIVKEKRILEPDPVSAGEGGVEGEAAGEGETGPAPRTGPVGTRQEALRRLAEVAEYFQRTEPHSPVSYLVQRAIKWGQMPLEIWLQDVIKDGTVLGQLRETLGLGSSSGGSEETG
jgi:type VI secretion system protein ImpA